MAPQESKENPAHFDGGHFTHAEAMRPYKLLFSGAIAGVVSRTSTAPVDRLRMLFQVHESSRMTISQGVRKMASEGTIKSFFRGNGANCLKIAPETALKFAINDRIKRFVAGDDTSRMGYFERLLSGGISGGIAQVSSDRRRLPYPFFKNAKLTNSLAFVPPPALLRVRFTR